MTHIYVYVYSSFYLTNIGCHFLSARLSYYLATQPTAHIRGGLAAKSDKRELSNKMRIPFLKWASVPVMQLSAATKNIAWPSYETFIVAHQVKQSLLWDTRVHYPVHKSPQPNSFNSLYTLHPISSDILFNNIHPHKPRAQNNSVLHFRRVSKHPHSAHACYVPIHFVLLI